MADGQSIYHQTTWQGTHMFAELEAFRRWDISFGEIITKNKRLWNAYSIERMIITYIDYVSFPLSFTSVCFAAFYIINRLCISEPVSVCVCVRLCICVPAFHTSIAN